MPSARTAASSGRLVGCRIAGAQVGEAVGKARPSLDIGQDLGDPHPRQQSLQLVGKQARGIRDDRLGSSDVELAVLDLDAVEFAAFRPASHEGQAFVQGGSTSSDIAIGIGFAVNSGVGSRRRQQVGLEGAIVAAADHPDIAALQPITQCGKDGGLVEAPVR